MPEGLLAQSRPPRIGMVGPRPLADSLVHPPIVRRLEELGYRDGVTMVLEYRNTGGFAAGARAAVRELIQLKCDVVSVFDEPAMRAVLEAPPVVPVVFYAVDFDPVEKGLIRNVRRPESNMTGIYSPISALAGKRLELVQEVLPGAKQFLVLSDFHSADQLRPLRAAADARRVRLTVIEFDQPPYDLAGAFEAGRRAGVDGFIGLSSPFFGGRRAELGRLFVKYKMPALGARLSVREPGYLAGYHPNTAKIARRTAEMLVQVVKGAKPADIPVEQSDEYDLVINMKTAKALGIKFSPAVLARATTVIE
jgi:putative tryptophan/tyrosine transport system substrate-binding protein